MTPAKQRPKPSDTLPAERKTATNKKACRSRPACLATADDDRPVKTAVVAKGCGATLPGKREAATDKKPAEATTFTSHR